MAAGYVSTCQHSAEAHHIIIDDGSLTCIMCLIEFPVFFPLTGGYLQCFDPADCAARTRSTTLAGCIWSCDLGSSAGWPPVMTKDKPHGGNGGLQKCPCMNVDTNEGDDILLADCNCLYLPYCDGASFSGSRWDTVPEQSGGHNVSLHFRGLSNLEAALDWAVTEAGLGTASDLVVTGMSAGGLATFLHADRIVERVRQAAVQRNVVSARAAPLQGFFLAEVPLADGGGGCGGMRPRGTQNYTDAMRQLVRMQNISAAFLPACTAAHVDEDEDELFKCFMAPHVAPFIQVPFFAFNSRFDAWQIQNVLGLPPDTWPTACAHVAIADLGNQFVKQFSMATKATPNGGAITSCVCHSGCPPYADVPVAGKSPIALYAAWTKGQDSGPTATHIDMRGPNADGDPGFLDDYPSCQPCNGELHSDDGTASVAALLAPISCSAAACAFVFWKRRRNRQLMQQSALG